ncbi:MAG: GNAT family N-acetyltransferase [Roseovarius sp.]|uniref:GNAT family N-acetyltransferase n=1 Tax=Roseovarius sp. TaxID=1486281 RepID=UPI0032EE37B4
MPVSRILRTDRFCIREIREGDRGAFLDCHADPRFAAFHRDEERRPGHLSSVFDLFLTWQAETPRRNFQFAIAPLDAPEGYAGNVGLRMAGLPPGEGELGIELIPAWWRRGVGTEVLRVILPWARDTHAIDTFIADTAPGNLAAERLAGAAGLRVVTQDGKRHWRSVPE